MTMDKDDIDEAYAKLGERLSEARSTLKDLRDARRELAALHHAAMNEITKAHTKSIDSINKACEAAIKDVLPGELKSLEESFMHACEVATTAVFKRFDTLADIMLGEDKRNDETLTQLIRRWKVGRE